MSEPSRHVGAMTKAMQAMPMGNTREVVRLGCLLADGKLEERTVGLDAPLSLDGLIPSFSLNSPLQKSHVLMTRDAHSVVTLHLMAGMKLRLVGEDAVIEGPRAVMLAPHARGRIQVDGKTLLFQLVPEPQKRTKASLPSSVMRGFFAQTDALFTFIVLASFSAHFGAIVVMESADFPMDPGISHVPDRVAELIFNEPTPPEVPPPTPTVTDETPTEVARTETNPTPDQPTHAERPTHTTTPSNTPAPMAAEEARLIAQTAANAVNSVLGAMGPGGDLQDLLATGAPAQDQARLFEDINGVQLAGTNATQMRTREGGGPVQTDFSIRQLAVRPGQVQEGETIVETGPRVSVSIPQTDDVDPIDGAGEFDARIVARMISTRRAQITACYEHAITRSPDLHGRVVVQLTIQENGSVTGVHTTDNTMGSDEVARCVESRIRSFRFTPGPEGGSVNFSFPFVFERQD